MSEFKLEEQSRRITLADWWDQVDINFDYGWGAHLRRVLTGLAVAVVFGTGAITVILMVKYVWWAFVVLVAVIVAYVIGLFMEDW